LASISFIGISNFLYYTQYNQPFFDALQDKDLLNQETVYRVIIVGFEILSAILIRQILLLRIYHIKGQFTTCFMYFRKYWRVILACSVNVITLNFIVSAKWPQSTI